jgi:hypothetical protein
VASTLDTHNINLLDIPMDDLKEAGELDDYLATPLEKVCDPPEWWWDHRTSYLTLSKMAFDFLSIPHESIGVHLCPL